MFRVILASHPQALPTALVRLLRLEPVPARGSS